MHRIRQEKIKKYIESKNVATIKELRELFPEVTLMTLHRDLSALEEMGIVTKYRGGVRSVHQLDDIEFNIRMKENTAGKTSMMKKAMKLTDAEVEEYFGETLKLLEETNKRPED